MALGEFPCYKCTSPTELSSPIHQFLRQHLPHPTNYSLCMQEAELARRRALIKAGKQLLKPPHTVAGAGHHSKDAATPRGAEHDAGGFTLLVRSAIVRSRTSPPCKRCIKRTYNAPSADATSYCSGSGRP